MTNNNIVTRENETASIEKLAAQRELYSKAKALFYIQIFIVVICLVSLSFLQLMVPKTDFTLIIATISLLAVVADIILEKYISNIKESAAKIQELFDSYVLDIKWNKILCFDQPEYFYICKYFNKHKSKKKDLTKLSNWYESDISFVSEKTGKLICQKINCNYDSCIRKRYNIVILTICISTIILIFLFTVFSEITLSKLLLTVVFPAVPIIHWSLKNIIANNDSIKLLEQLNILVNSSWSDLKNGVPINDETIRQIQDGIYLNRKDSPLIPDFVYDILRFNLETQTRYTVKQLVSEIKQQ